MNNRLFATLTLALLSTLDPQLSTWAQGTSFTYQGYLDQNGAAFTGSAELQATLWSVPTGGTALAANDSGSVVVGVTNGLFVLPLDFGSNFPGADRWVQFDVRTVIGPFTTLTPRQKLTAASYAISAGTVTGAVADAQLSGNVALLNGNQTFTGLSTFNNAVGINGALSVDNITPPSGNLMAAASVDIGTGGSPYHHLTFGGGNSFGYLYGSYQNLGDGIHLGYNYYEDAAGDRISPRLDGGTSRITAGYGTIALATGDVAVQGNIQAPTDRLFIDANGYVGIGTTTPQHLLQVGPGVSAAYCDGFSWVGGSDRNVKSGFQPVDATAILSKVAALPITCWHYTNDATTPHLGPMAQDFYAAFDVGADDQHIAIIDEGGVALAAIQGLDQRLAEKDAELKALRARRDEKLLALKKENEALQERLERLEKIAQDQESN